MVMESAERPKRNPYCSRCRNHGKSAQVKGHKRHCEYRYCQCEGCKLVECRQIVSAAQIKRRRYQKQDEECGRRIEISPPVLTRASNNNDPATLIAKTLIGSTKHAGGGGGSKPLDVTVSNDPTTVGRAQLQNQLQTHMQSHMMGLPAFHSATGGASLSDALHLFRYTTAFNPHANANAANLLMANGGGGPPSTLLASSSFPGMRAEQFNNVSYAPPFPLPSASAAIANSIAPAQTCYANTISYNNNSHSSNNSINFNNGFAQTTVASAPSIGAMSNCGSVAVNKAAVVESPPFADPNLVGKLMRAGGATDRWHPLDRSTCSTTAVTNNDPASLLQYFTTPAKFVDSTTVNPTASAKMLSTSNCSGSSRMLTSSASAASSRSGTNGQNLVSKNITFPPQSPMDSLKEWSLSTFKCAKQLINDSQLQNDIEQLRGNRDKLVEMLRFGRQLTDHYSQLVRTQKQLHSLMNDMSIKCSANNSNLNNSHQSTASGSHEPSNNKQVVANFLSLSNILSSTTTSQGTSHHSLHHSLHHQNNGRSNSSEQFEDLSPVPNHLKSFSDMNLVDDFRKNANTLDVAIRNGEKLIAALNVYCSNLSTLINKTIEDTLTAVKQFESARLEYDTENNNSSNFISPTAHASSVPYSSDKAELARLRYEQLKQDVQIKMRILEENTVKVMHKQLLLFNGAFASYTSGNTAALDTTLKQYSIRET